MDIMESCSEATIRQIDRFIKKVIQKFPSDSDPVVFTDIHVRISPDTGDIMAFDDDDAEITRCIVEEWINYKDSSFYDSAAALLRARLNVLSPEIDVMCILRPFSFVLENEDKEHVSELYISDDNINIIGGDLMDGWDKDLDEFLDKLMKE